jgi:hypothetical protein
VIAKEQDSDGKEASSSDLPLSNVEDVKPSKRSYSHQEIVEISDSDPVISGADQAPIQNTDHGMVASEGVATLADNGVGRSNAREESSINNGIASPNLLYGRVGELQQQDSSKRRKRLNSMTTLSTAPDLKSKPPAGIALTTIEILT